MAHFANINNKDTTNFECLISHLSDLLRVDIVFIQSHQDNIRIKAITVMKQSDKHIFTCCVGNIDLIVACNISGGKTPFTVM